MCKTGDIFILLRKFVLESVTNKIRIFNIMYLVLN